MSGIMAGASCPEELVRAVTVKMNVKDLIVSFFLFLKWLLSRLYLEMK